MSEGGDAATPTALLTPVAAGHASPYYEAITDMDESLRRTCDAVVVSGARWQLLAVAALFGGAAVGTWLTGPIAIAFGMAATVPLSIFAERAVVTRLIALGVSPLLAKRIARGARVLP